jgi:Ca2+-binding RTX toxin-like protein
MAVITGTNGNDNLVGTADSDTIDPLLGNDTVDGLGGSDTLVVGYDTFYYDPYAGASVPQAMSSLVTSSGGAFGGNIRSTYGGHAVALTGIEHLQVRLDRFHNQFSINASALAQGATANLDGGEGHDRLDIDLSVFAGLSFVVAANGSVTVNVPATITSFESFGIISGSGNDYIVTGSGMDSIVAGGGNDLIDGGSGQDQMTGGAGDDVYFVDNAFDWVIENGGEGTDEIRTALVSYSLAQLPNVEKLTGTAATGQVLTGNAADNVVAGAGGNDQLSGAGGNDILSGGGGHDSLDGGSGDDMLDGGSGDDILLGGAGDDSYSGGEGIDRLDVSGEGGPVAINLHASLFIFPFGHPNATRSLGPGEGLDSFGNYETVTGIENLILTAGNDRALGSDVANQIEAGAGDDSIYGMGGNDVIIAGSGDDDIGGGDGDDLIEGGDGIDAIGGDSGTDIINAGAGDDSAFGGTGNDALYGGAGDDLLRGEDGDDMLSGGDGDDLLRGGAGVDTFDGGTDGGGVGSLGLIADRISFFESRATQAVVADLRTGVISNDGFGNVETMTGIESFGADTAFADTFYGNDNANGFFVGRGDFVYGFGGDDLIEARAAPGVVDGGAGTDLLQLSSNGGFLLPDANGNGEAEVAPAMTAGWTVDLAAGTLRDGFGNAGTVAGIENLVGSALGDELRGDGSANRIDGGSGNDRLLMQDGGEDTALGGEGNDVLYYGSALSAGDIANGGEGRDAIVLQGNVTAVLTDTNLVGIESISIQSGANASFGDTANNFYDFDITTADGNVASGQQLIVNAQSLRSGEDFTFDGSAESDGKFLVYGGHGVDNLTGGAGADVFLFEGQRWGANDKVDGGAGRDALVISAGSGLTRIEFGADSLANIESISLNNRYATDPSQKPSYELVLHNGNVAPGGTLIVNGSSIPAGQLVNIDGRGVHDGNLILFGGGGHDTLFGGDGNDTLLGGGGADGLTGGAGADTFRYDAASDSSGGLHDLIGDFQTGVDKIDLSRIDANTHAAGDQAFSWIGSNAFSGTGAASAGELRVFDDNGRQRIEGDTNGDGLADLVIVLQIGTAPIAQGDFLP